MGEFKSPVEGLTRPFSNMSNHWIDHTQPDRTHNASGNVNNHDQSLKDALLDLGSRSTVHGISNIVTSKSIFKKFLWIAAFLTCFCLVIMQLVNIFVLYVSYETKTSFQLEYNTEFPSVTICNNGYAQFDANIAHAVDRMLIKCQYAMITQTCEIPKSYWSNKFGNCFTMKLPDYLSKFSGLQGGLSVVLNLETFRQRSDIEHGMMISVHQPNIFPFPLEEGIVVDAGDEVSIGIKMRHTRRLGGLYGDCVDANDFYNKTYTLKACELLCWEQFLLDQCDCLDPHVDSILRRLKPLSQGKCYVPSYNELNDCFKKARRMFNGKNNNCSCNLPCSEQIYTTESLRRQWKRGPDAGSLASDVCSTVYNKSWSDCPIDKSGLNFVKVNVYLQDLTHETITQEPLYGRSQMLADIGGSLGLFIGASVLSFGEIIEAFYVFFHMLFKRAKGQHKTDSHSQ